MSHHGNCDLEGLKHSLGVLGHGKCIGNNCLILSQNIMNDTNTEEENMEYLTPSIKRNLDSDEDKVEQQDKDGKIKKHKSSANSQPKNSNKSNEKITLNSNNKITESHFNLKQNSNNSKNQTAIVDKDLHISEERKTYKYEKCHQAPFEVFIRKNASIKDKNFCDLDIVRLLNKCNVKCVEIKRINRGLWSLFFDKYSNANDCVNNSFLINAGFNVFIPKHKVIQTG